MLSSVVGVHNLYIEMVYVDVSTLTTRGITKGDLKMKVENVIYSDFSLLVDGYVKAKTENSGACTYGVKSDSYFENMVISFHLSHINFIELLALRKICSSILPLELVVDKMNCDITTANSDDASKKCNEKFHQICKGLALIRQDIESVESPYPLEKDLVLLTGHYSFELVARFEGSSIMSIIGVFPESKFYNRGLGNFEIPDRDTLDNILITDFIKSLYSAVNSQLSSVDILTDIMMRDKFYSYVTPETPVKLSHITSSIGELRVLNNTQQNISSELRSMKQFRDIIFREGESDKFINDDIIYHIVAKTPIQTYILLQLYSNFVYSTEDLKVVFASDDIEYMIPDEFDSFFARIQSFIGTNADLRQDIVKISKNESDKVSVNNVNILAESTRYGSTGTQTVKNQSSSFDRIGIYRLIPSSAYICYTLKFTKSDFEKFKLEIPVWAMTSDLQKILTNVDKFIKTIEKSLS